MATRSRGSRFVGADYTLGVPLADERKTPSQREAELRAQLDVEKRKPAFWLNKAREAMSEDDYAKAVAEIARAHQAAGKASGAAGLGDAHTDAVAMVEQAADGWRVRWALAKFDGAYLVRSVQVEPESRSTPRGGITTNMLRELSPASAVALAADAQEVIVETALSIAGLESFVNRMGPAPEGKLTRGRPRTSDRRMAEVALAYLEELPKGKGITQRIADRFTQKDGRRVDPSTVRDWIRRARDDGFLSRADGQMGRRGATPGPRFLDPPPSQKGDLQ